MHPAARRKLCDHPRQKVNHRLSVMFNDPSREQDGDEPVANLRDDEAGLERESPKQDALWKGMTVFYQAEVVRKTFLLDTPAGCVQMRLIPEEYDDVYAQWNVSSSASRKSQFVWLLMRNHL